MSIRIGIIGSRGIPNHYGGFERLAEQLSLGLAAKGHELFVYNSHNHAYQDKQWNGIHLIHCYDPEYLVGCSGQFIYDLNCILDARSRNFDVILVLGYTSSSVWGRLLPRKSVTIYHMDGFEWKRTKYSKTTRKFLQYAERLAVRFSDFHISDSPAIQDYYREKYNLATEYIAYGAKLHTGENMEVIKAYGVTPHNYFLLIARMEPENNVETILDGFAASTTDKIFLVVGNMRNAFGKFIVQKFSHDQRIRFIGALYDDHITHTLRLYSKSYFHGHSSGGTNPSLLEAMASKCLIVAHDNIFNKMVLQEDAFYFTTASDIKDRVEKDCPEPVRHQMVGRNMEKINTNYNWEGITRQYERFMLQCRYLHIHERNRLSKGYVCE